MARRAAIDVGTNTVLLLVAEERERGWVAVVERAEITRLGRGVDRTGRLDPQAIRDTVAVLARYAGEARALGAGDPVCVATSAARDAANGAEFFEAARREAGLAPEVVSGDEEARLVWASAWRDFGAAGGLCVLDVGGGSTEVCVGDGPAPRARRSLQLGAVRLTERVAPPDPPGPAALALFRQRAAEALAPAAALLAGHPRPARMVGVAGTVTTLAAVSRELARYDAERVHGSELTLAEVDALQLRLAGLTTAARARLPGMEPKRADVIVAGSAVVAEAMRALGFDRLTVSDRGVRWGLLYDRFGRDG
ncbi:Ppx/GppA phosphatase family protein [Anaeromyxobacter diazotrophicus]|uniref:Exopolyphosphatase n=1 Tax=Anaeromyxobacter diazotrophicus TaxID=2590199 RepID=A0A7I9VGV2_9BACT|nr:Ppx/GppA phosphatase family protein [Anaeromyxobacter diazotrophicus]GEJ55623.1 exopolyphosphatase [Anaeromyxobacter diazotrophicus]